MEYFLYKLCFFERKKSKGFVTEVYKEEPCIIDVELTTDETTQWFIKMLKYTFPRRKYRLVSITKLPQSEIPKYFPQYAK